MSPCEEHTDPRLLLTVTILGLCGFASAAEPTVIDLWPGKPPGETKELPPETDTTKPTDKPVGDRKIIKLTNVSKPTLAIYRPEKDKDTGAAIIICPGGAHVILAYDHEGTEVAEFLAKHGVTGIVLKYRVPARDKDRRWRAAVQDAQRAIRVVRGHAAEWKHRPEADRHPRVLGRRRDGRAGDGAVRAGPNTRPWMTWTRRRPGRTSRPSFTPAYLVNKEKTGLVDYAKPTKDTPPMFLVYAYDDPVDPRNALSWRWR